jgi:hypothetical protein
LCQVNLNSKKKTLLRDSYHSSHYTGEESPNIKTPSSKSRFVPLSSFRKQETSQHFGVAAQVKTSIKVLDEELNDKERQLYAQAHLDDERNKCQAAPEWAHLK